MKKTGNGPNIGFIFRDTPESRSEAFFAAELVRHFGQSVLYVFIDVGSDPMEDQDLLVEEEQGIIRTIQQWIGTKSYGLMRFTILRIDLKTYAIPKNMLVISNEFGNMRKEANVLSPAYEGTLCARGEGEVLIPLGTRDSALRTVEIGLPLIAAMGFEKVVFYHTTFRDKSVMSDDPSDHMNESAREILESAEEAADQLGLFHRSIPAMDTDVARGINLAAQRISSPLILMGYGDKIWFGWYPDALRKITLVPVMTIGRY